MRSSPAVARVARLAAWAALIVLALVVASILLIGFQTLPRPARRATVEGALRALLLGYAGLLAGAVAGVAWLVPAIVRRRRLRYAVGWRARALLLCASTLLALGLSELAAASWSAWRHRMPTLPTRFDPPDGAGHVVALGGSGALGHPYGPEASIASCVSWGLERAMPGRRFRSDILAKLGASLPDQHRDLAAIRQRPAAVIVYAGHNEFTGRFEEERSVDLDEAPANPPLHALYRLSLASPLCRLIYESLSRNRLDGPPPRLSRHALVDAPMFTPSERADVLDDFGRRLEAIVAWSERVGAVPILVIEPGDESGFPPNRSLLPASATAEDHRWVEAQYRSAREAEAASESGRAEANYREIVARFPGFAEGHFRLARLLERTGRQAESLDHYIAARDLDGMPFRCISAFADAYREVAARHPSCLLIDGPAVLRSICPGGIVGPRAMHDGHHASIRGITALARAILAGLRSRGDLGWSEGDVPRIEPADVAGHAGLDAPRWITASDWGRTFYRWVSGFRFDPSEHVANAERFEDAIRRIKAGEPPGSLRFDRLSLDPLGSR